MKRLSLLVAMSALLVAGFAQNADAQELTGGVILQDTGARDIPIGVNETGRYARFIMDSRMTDLNFKNRDFEAWKPLDVRSKEKMRHYVHGNLSTSRHPIQDQSVGRYVRHIVNEDFVNNNMWMENRDFQALQIPSPFTADAGSAMSKEYLRGLGAGTHRTLPGRTSVRIGVTNPVLYF